MGIAKTLIDHFDEIKKTAEENNVQVIIEINQEEKELTEALEVYPELSEL